jgi:hypothetical protein
MTESIASLAQNAADKSSSANAPAQHGLPLDGSFAGLLRGHKAGIGIGLVGLVIGTLAASPLLAIAGLAGGIAAGTVLLDSRKQGTNLIAHDATSSSNSRGEPGAHDAAIQPTTTTDISRTFCHPPAPGTIAFDSAFDACEPDSPKQSGNTQASRRQIF